MKTLYQLVVLFLLLPVLLLIQRFQTTAARQASASPTPTYDPLREPPLPLHPTEYELGRNLYWHWCMTCHGDRGQGLTDEFRRIWDPDHQNCWARGCHSGRPGETGFPIPTVVPPLVDEDHLVQFSSQEALADFLKATHPPQKPGILKREEYQAIALFVFTMNGRASGGAPITEIPTPILTQTLPLSRVSNLRSFRASAIVILIIAIVLTFVLIGATAHSRK